jgi:hypothetical protein
MAEEVVVPLEKTTNPTSPKYWGSEIEASSKFLRDWQKRAAKIVQRYLGEHLRGKSEERTSLNVFHSNTKTIQDMLYSSLPKIEASRTNQDSNDDIARVASETIQRMINLDIAANGEEYDSVLRSVLQDRLVPGLGCARVRYEVQHEQVMVPEVKDAAGFMVTPEHEETVLVSESAPIEYYHWQDVLWGWGRSFATLPWIGFRAYLTKKEVGQRFGQEFVDQLEYAKQKVSENSDEFQRDEDKSPWSKAEIWEIWDKKSRTVVWYSKGAKSLLDIRTDPLKLTGFYPCPPFLIANATTSLYRPTPDYLLAQDLYNEVDILQTRISLITEAVKVVGVYDAKCEGLKRMLKEGVENDLIPVDEWAMFAETGGLKGKVDWFPIEDVANTLGKLQQLRDETLRLLQMVTGMADVMQGALGSPYEGVGQSEIKAHFGSVRIQALQDQFARFAGDLMQLKAEVICKHFEPQTIMEQSNMGFSPDADMVPSAVQLLKSPNMANLRIEVRPETVAMVDYGRLKAERTEFLNALATFMQSAAPMLEQDKAALPYLLKMLQWTMSGFKGSQEIEGVLDKAIEQAIQNLQQQQEQPDPQAEADQAKLQGELQKIQAKLDADLQLRQADAQADMETVRAQNQAKMGEIMATHHARVTEIQQKLRADLMKESAAFEGDMAQIEATAEAEIEKDRAEGLLDVTGEVAKARIEMENETEKSLLKMREIGEQSSAKIDEIIASQLLTDNDGEKDVDTD